jgi:prepilin-type N-terminal cleavage/methylation domain-containing protein
MKIANDHSKQRSRQERAFSLIEMIGVMAIIALIAAAAGPALIKRVDYAAKTTEKATLASMTNAMVRTCLYSNQIPDVANIAGAIQKSLNCNLSLITNTPRGFTRLFITDPAVVINGVTNNLPYTQSSTVLSSQPANARAVIISTIAKALPSISPNAAQFAEIWNAPADTIPSVLSSWGGRGEDLQIERVDFGTLFHKVVLKNVEPVPAVGPAAIPTLGFYSFETYGILNVRPGSQASAYYLDGTLLTLYRSSHYNSSPPTNPTDINDADTREIIHTDISFIYQNHKWTRRLEGSDDVAGSFGTLVNNFLKQPAPPDPKFAATQQSVMNLMYQYLWAYTTWANGDPSSVTNAYGTVITPAVPKYAGGGSGNGVNYPTYSQANEAQANLATFTDNLIH